MNDVEGNENNEEVGEEDAEQSQQSIDEIATTLATVMRSNLTREAKKFVLKVLNDVKASTSKSSLPPQVGPSARTGERREGNLPIVDPSKLVRRPRMFNGSNKEARQWFDEYEFSCELNSWDDDSIKCKYFPAYLEESALTWYRNLVKIPAKASNTRISWALITEKFHRNYFSVMNRAKIGR